MSDVPNLELKLSSTLDSLKSSIGPSFPTYNRLLECYLCGRITKEELECSLREILQDNISNYDLHNKYLGLVLEKVAAVEAVALVECRIPDSNVFHKESSRLQLEDLKMDSFDLQLFTQASERKAIEEPFIQEETFTKSKLEDELSNIEKSFGKPLLCSMTGTLPDRNFIRHLLTAYLRSYDLEVLSIEDEHIEIILNGLEDHLGNLFDFCKNFLSEGTDGTLHLDMNALINGSNLNGQNLPVFDNPLS